MLFDLGTGLRFRLDFRRSSSTLSTNTNSQAPTPDDPRVSSSEVEPLLSLLTSHHPFLSSAINGSLSAYTSSKDFSPSFKSGAEFVEKIGSPVMHTVGTAGRISGVETGVRWWLKRPPGHLEEHKSKRGRARDRSDTDVEKGYPDPAIPQLVPRNLSITSLDSLPPYDDQRSPQYVEKESREDSHPKDPRGQPKTWSSKLIISTSGLGVAMRQDSLECLRYCLEWVRWANNHLRRITIDIRDIIQKPESDNPQSTSEADARAGRLSGIVLNESDHKPPGDQDDNKKIQLLTNQILEIMKQITSVVSDYAGSALPENARAVVAQHLMAIPQRFRSVAMRHSNTNSLNLHRPVVSQAHKVLGLAREGLDTMAHIHMVINGTIESAEAWCERLGRQGRRQSAEGQGALEQAPNPQREKPAGQIIEVKSEQS